MTTLHRKTRLLFLLISLLLVAASAVQAQDDGQSPTANRDANSDNRSTATSGHPNTGEFTPGLGSPDKGTPGSTGGSHTPGTSASGQSVNCPQLTMEASDGSGGNVGTGRSRTPTPAPNEPPRASTHCADAGSGSSGTPTDQQSAPGTSGSATNGQQAK